MKLRPMTMEDALLMLKWKNYPETRKFAIQSSDKITKENHLKWLPKNIKFFQVIEYNGKPCGAVRVESKEVSIWVDRSVRGKGVATKAVDAVAKSGQTAKIVSGNIPSMRVFISCGFKPVSYNGVYYTFKK